MKYDSVYNKTLTAERARQLLRYEPETGRLIWTRGKKGARDDAIHAGCIAHSGYRRIKIDRVDYQAHRIAWLIHTGEWPKYDIDHINGIRDDNRIENLRDITRRHNSENQRVGRTGLLGTSYCAGSGRWLATIGVEGRKINLGYWETERDAHVAYKTAKRLLHKGCTI